MDRSDSPRVSLDIAEKINQLYKRLNNDPESWILNRYSLCENLPT